MLQSPLLALSGVYHVKERLFSKLLKEHGIQHMSPAQTRILMALWAKDDVPVRHLAEVTSLDKSTLSLSLTRMEKIGVIQRVGDTIDRRVVRVQLTDLGKSFKEGCKGTMNELSEILFSDISEEEMQVFTSVLKKMFANLSSQENLPEIPD